MTPKSSPPETPSRTSARIFGFREDDERPGFTLYLPPCIRTGGETRITRRLQISPGPRNHSCSLDVYLLSQRMLNFFIGLMLSTPFGFVLLVPFRAAFEDGLGALLPLWYPGQPL